MQNIVINRIEEEIAANCLILLIQIIQLLAQLSAVVKLNSSINCEEKINYYNKCKKFTN